MLSKQQFFIALFLLMLIVFAGGFFAGRSSKHCPEVVAEKVESDTSETYLPITGGAGSPLTVITEPINQSIKKVSAPVDGLSAPVSRLSELVKNDTATFYGIDTLRFEGQDSLFVAISEHGNCNGVFYRESLLGGKIKERTITNTITNVIEKPAALFQLNGGVQSSFIGKWKTVDIGPALQLQLKQKHSVGYSYMIGSDTHNISLLTKLK